MSEFRALFCKKNRLKIKFSRLLDKNGDGFVTAEEARDFFAGSDER